MNCSMRPVDGSARTTQRSLRSAKMKIYRSVVRPPAQALRRSMLLDACRFAQGGEAGAIVAEDYLGKNKSCH